MPGFQNGEGPWQLRNESSAGPDSVVSKAGANLRLQKILTTAFCRKFADVDDTRFMQESIHIHYSSNRLVFAVGILRKQIHIPLQPSVSVTVLRMSCGSK
jgi:uncharacterized protein YuzE